LQAVAGYDGLDPRQSRDVPDRVDVSSELRAGVEGVRIGILEHRRRVQPPKLPRRGLRNGPQRPEDVYRRLWFIDAYDGALTDVDMLIMPTCISVASKFRLPPTPWRP
jgi:hypothetical protein